jgi:hypothetical protein
MASLPMKIRLVAWTSSGGGVIRSFSEAGTLAEGGRRPHLPKPDARTPKDDPKTAHLGDRDGSNRDFRGWHHRCHPLVQAVGVLAESGNGDGTLSSARDDVSRRNDTRVASSLHSSTHRSLDRSTWGRGDNRRAPRLGESVPPRSPARSPFGVGSGRQASPSGGICTTPTFAPFDPAFTTSAGGAGAAHYEVLRGPPLFVEGGQFDVSFRVVGTDGTVLTSECFTVTVK